MDTQQILEYDWPYILRFFPEAEELDASAQHYGALRRRREIKSAATLLRLAFAYAFCGMSLRETAAWAALADVADISDVALMKRLRNAAPWLGHLLGVKLAEHAPVPPLSSRSISRVRLIDATCISKPGSRNTDWRLHLGFLIPSMTIEHAEVTDVSGGETLQRFAVHAQELIIADRGYAQRASIAAVARSEAWSLIRLNWRNLPLQDPSGRSFDLFAHLRDLADAVPGDFPVVIKRDATRRTPALPARVLAIRRSSEAAAVARKKALRAASKQGHKKIDPRTLEACDYFVVLTTAPVSLLSTEEGLEWYRFRWQIELAFKRLKSLLELDVLPAKDPPLARSILYTKLLAALILEELTSTFLAFSPWGYRLARTSSEYLADSALTD